jgi:hypothetical protein
MAAVSCLRRSPAADRRRLRRRGDRGSIRKDILPARSRDFRR